MAPKGYAYEIVGGGAKDLICPVCTVLIRDCVELPCAHTMCKNCVDFISKQAENSETDTVCPTCETIYIMDWVKESKAMDRIITTTVKIKCPQVQLGCVWQGDISTVREHEEKCKFHMIECTNVGCTAEIMRSNLPRHLNNCNYRNVNCEHCGGENKFNLMEEHYKICDLCPIICPNRRCKLELIRKDLIDHLTNHCYHQEIDCQFAEVGCPQKITRQRTKKHLDENVNEHMTMLFGHTKEIQKAHEETKRELAEAHDSLVKTTIILKEFNDRLNETKRELDETKAELAKMKKQADDRKVQEEEQRKLKEVQKRKISSEDQKQKLDQRPSNGVTLERKPRKKVSPFTKPTQDFDIPLKSPVKSPLKKKISAITVERSDSDASSTSSASSNTSQPGSNSPVSPVMINNNNNNNSPPPIISTEIPEETSRQLGTLDHPKKRNNAIKPIMTRPCTPLQAIVEAMNSSPANEYPNHFNALISSMESDHFYVVNGDLLIKINTHGTLRPYSVLYIQPWEERRRNVFHDMRHNKRTKHQSDRVSIEANPQVGIIKLLVNCNISDTHASVVCTQQNTSFMPAFMENWGWGFNVPSGLHRCAFYTQDYVLLRFRQRNTGIDQMMNRIDRYD